MESGHMKTRSVLDILAGATRRLQQASGSRGASAMKRRLKGLLKPPFQSPLPKPPARRMHGASHRSQVCCIAARWAHFGNREHLRAGPRQAPTRYILGGFWQGGGLGGPQGRQPCPCSTWYEYHRKFLAKGRR
jgi:hypothetical protein